jgi:hypothetical protein
MTRVWLSLIVGIILIFSAVTLGGYNNFVSAQLQNRITLSNGAIITPVLGQCRGWNDVKPHIYLVTEHCAIPAPSNQPIPPNPCSDKPGTIFWPSSGGCVPAFCPPGANSEIRGARLNSGECDTSFGSGSSVNSNNNTNNQIPSAAVAAAAAMPIGYVSAGGGPVLMQGGGVGVIPAEAPIGDTAIGLGEGEAGEILEGVDFAFSQPEVYSNLPVVIAAGGFAVGWWIGCGGEFC